MEIGYIYTIKYKMDGEITLVSKATDEPITSKNKTKQNTQISTKKTQYHQLRRQWGVFTCQRNCGKCVYLCMCLFVCFFFFRFLFFYFGGNKAAVPETKRLCSSVCLWQFLSCSLISLHYLFITFLLSWGKIQKDRRLCVLKNIQFNVGCFSRFRLLLEVWGRRRRNLSLFYDTHCGEITLWFCVCVCVSLSLSLSAQAHFFFSVRLFFCVLFTLLVVTVKG